MKLTVVIEQGETSYGAYAHNLPGCIAVGKIKSNRLHEKAVWGIKMISLHRQIKPRTQDEQQLRYWNTVG